MVGESGDFAVFSSTAWPRLSRIAFLLTGDAVVSANLLERTLIRGWASWPHDDADPESYLLRTLMKLYLARRPRWRRRTSASPSAASHADVTAAPSGVDFDPEWLGLGKLSRRQWATVVLRYATDLTVGQVSAALNIDVEATDRLTRDAITRLQRDDPLVATPAIPDQPALDLAAEETRLRDLLTVHGHRATNPSRAPFTMFASRRRRRRRARIAAAALASAALAAATTLAIMQPRSHGVRPGRYVIAVGDGFGNQPQAPGSPLPTYTNGMKLLTHLTVGAGEIDASGTFTPTGWGLSIDADAGCATELSGKATETIHILINGHDAQDETCSASGEFVNALAIDATGQQQLWRQYGVALGQPSTVSVHIATSHGAKRAVAVGPFGIYQTIPRADYPVPTAPPLLLPTAAAPITLDSRQVGKNGTWTITATIGDQLDVAIAAPGSIIIDVGSQQLADVERYDYRAHDEPVFLDPANPACTSEITSPGDNQIQITVHATSFTDAGWYITEQKPATTS